MSERERGVSTTEAVRRHADYGEHLSVAAIEAILAALEDAVRLDQLEAMVRELGGLVLHVDARMVGPTRDWPRFPGLGLEPGALRRTLRQAIDDSPPRPAARAAEGEE